MKKEKQGGFDFTYSVLIEVYRAEAGARRELDLLEIAIAIS
jgi:hypothetical protein